MHALINDGDSDSCPCDRPAPAIHMPLYTLGTLAHSSLPNVPCRGKTNFFEKRVGEYQKSGVMNSLSGQVKHQLSFNEDF